MRVNPYSETPPTPPPPPPPPEYASFREWTRLSGLSRSKTYQLLRNKQLRAVRIGRAVRIDVRHGLAVLASMKADYS